MRIAQTPSLLKVRGNQVRAYALHVVKDGGRPKPLRKEKVSPPITGAAKPFGTHFGDATDPHVVRDVNLARDRSDTWFGAQVQAEKGTVADERVRSAEGRPP